jgi:predicted GNAT family acetyltransferase
MIVQHDVEHQRFFVSLPDGEAELRYASFGADVLDIRHTEVPRAARGQGVADALIRAALAYAREHQLQVIVTCPYARHWFGRHPEERPADAVDRPT